MVRFVPLQRISISRALVGMSLTLIEQPLCLVNLFEVLTRPFPEGKHRSLSSLEELSIIQGLVYCADHKRHWISISRTAPIAAWCIGSRDWDNPSHKCSEGRCRTSRPHQRLASLARLAEPTGGLDRPSADLWLPCAYGFGVSGGARKSEGKTGGADQVRSPVDRPPVRCTAWAPKPIASILQAALRSPFEGIID